jgi:hypothetical protein
MRIFAIVILLLVSAGAMAEDAKHIKHKIVTDQDSLNLLIMGDIENTKHMFQLEHDALENRVNELEQRNQRLEQRIETAEHEVQYLKFHAKMY